eukprot:3610946-Amphidinium_carterae.1
MGRTTSQGPKLVRASSTVSDLSSAPSNSQRMNELAVASSPDRGEKRHMERVLRESCTDKFWQYYYQPEHEANLSTVSQMLLMEKRSSSKPRVS